MSTQTTLDSSYCFPDHFLTIRSPETAIQSCIFFYYIFLLVWKLLLFTSWLNYGLRRWIWLLYETLRRPEDFCIPDALQFYLIPRCVDTTWAQMNASVSSVNLSLFGRVVNLCDIGLWLCVYKLDSCGVRECEMFIVTHAYCRLLKSTIELLILIHCFILSIWT